ncbi:MAG: hypothetical protein IJV99_03265 [Clostridia bacterium]|nr:hypothetical protein [Clostridia bacterium]
MRRPRFVRQLFETTSEHDYVGKPFKGIGLNPDIRRKIYFDNANKLFGKPRKIDISYFEKQVERISKIDGLTDIDKYDLQYIINNI